jgi:hypothetical protein
MKVFLIFAVSASSHQGLLVLQNGASAADHMILLLIFRFDGHNYELPA